MLFQVVTENGVKKIKPLTADTGTGAPVGSYLMLEKKSNPQGYLYCDGSTFDETIYPALYQYLGTNVLPDWREFSPVGAEQNTTNVYDASTNPTGVIHDHDVYAEGEAKDDQLQNIVGEWYGERLLLTGSASGAVTQTDAQYYPVDQGTSGNHHTLYSFDASRVARTGTVTRGKRKAVFVYIKATSGLTENQQENVLNTINDNLSYSTTEHKTGKKWIDGKDIYSKSFSIAIANFPYSTGITNVDNVAKIEAIGIDQSNNFYTIPFSTVIEGVAYVRNVYFQKTNGILYSDGNTSPVSITVTLEYTKTT